MKALVQRVKHARVDVGGRTVGRIGSGMVILLGVGLEDDADAAHYLAEKCSTLRIFEDENGKMNRSLLDCGGAALVVSQFTLYADASHGRRPSFSAAAPPDMAEKLYREFVSALRAMNVPVETGRFRAEMALELCNDGPVTIMLESR